MLKKDKLQLILRAKRGSQILKYQNPSQPLTSSSTIPAGSPYMVSTGIPEEIPESKPLQFSYSSPELKGQMMPFDFSNIKPLPYTDTRPRFKFKHGFGMLQDVANGLVNAGRSNQINSSGVDIAFGAADMVGDIASKINPVAGAAVKGVTTIFKGLDTIWGSKSKEFGVNQATTSQLGGSYGGSVATINDAASKANKKYGLFSGGARREANALIDKAALQQNMMTEIAKTASDQRSMANNVSYMQNQMDLNGGYDQRYIRAAKHGIKIQDKIDFIKTRRLQSRINVNTKQVEEFKEGGQIEWKPEIVWDVESFKEGGQIEWKPEITWEPEIQKFKKGTRTLEQLIAYAKEKNPRFIQRLSESPHGIEFIDDNGNKGTGNVYLEWSTDNEGNAIIYPRIQEMEDKSLKFLSSSEAWERANKNNNILIMSPEEAEIFFAEDPEYQTAYKRGWPNMFKNYLEKVKSSTKELKEGGYIDTAATMSDWWKGTWSYLSGNKDSGLLESQYKPSKSNNPNVKYYYRKGLNNDVVKNILGGSEYGKKDLFGKDLFYKDFNDVWNRLSNQGGRAERNTDNSHLGTYTIGIGKDSKGRYISYYDKFDWAPDGVKELFHPYEIYNRIYEDEFNKIQESLNNIDYKGSNPSGNWFFKSGKEQYNYIKNHKEGGSLKEELETPEIEATNQKNLIPEGALHKNKHHMEHTDGLTQKGIPVIDNEGEQQAEIELNEIIFTLEVTKKLEELYKDGSDEAAIEAGKLLVKEILFNTDDRTNLIAKCEKGGKLNDVN